MSVNPLPSLSPRFLTITGLFLVTVGIVILIGLLTYSPSDSVAIPFSGQSVTDSAVNASGLIGASLAYWLLPNLGYTTMLLSMTAMLLGYQLIRKRYPCRPFLSMFTIAAGLLTLSLLAGWLGLHLYLPMAEWGGAFGISGAAAMTQLIGKGGSLVFLFFLLTSCAVLLTASPWHTIHLDKEEATLIPQNRWLSPGNNSRNLAPRNDMIRHENDDSSRNWMLKNVYFEASEEGKEFVDSVLDSEDAEEKLAYSDSSEDDQQVLAHLPIRLLASSEMITTTDYEEIELRKQHLVDTLANYGIPVSQIEAVAGPTMTRFILTPASGVKISAIRSLQDDLSMALASEGVRIIAPIPGLSAVGIEMPNSVCEPVQIRPIIDSPAFQECPFDLPLVLGRTVEGDPFVDDLASLPHLLIAGATGSGKSVCLNSIITGLLYACSPDEVRFVFIDPKKIELADYARLKNTYLAVPFDPDSPPIATEVHEALSFISSCEREMDKRYELFAETGVRNLTDYNLWAANTTGAVLPRLVIVIDELADLMLSAGRHFETPIARLAQMARAVGIHLIVATQRPTVDVVTGLIKANFPARIAFQVPSKVDSRTIIDQNGAESLIGSGDLLYQKGASLIRLQGAYISPREIDRVTSYFKKKRGPSAYLLPPEVHDEMELHPGFH